MCLLWKPSLQAATGASCDADPTQGIPPLIASSSAKGCSAPAEDFVAAVPAILEGVLKKCLPVAGMTLAQADAAVKQRVHEIQFSVSTHCAALPPAPRMACYVAIVVGSLGADALECVTKGFAEGAPLSQDNKRLVKSALDATFDLKNQRDFFSKSRQFAGKEMDAAERAAFLGDLGNKWESARALTWAEKASAFTEYLSSDENTRGALARGPRRGVEGCELGGVGSELSSAVTSGRRNP